MKNILIALMVLFTLLCKGKSEPIDTSSEEEPVFYSFPSYLEMGENFFWAMPDSFQYHPGYKIGNSVSEESNFVKAGLLQTKIYYYMKRKNKVLFFKTFQDYKELNKKMKFQIDNPVEARLKKNWNIKDSLIFILAEIEFMRTEKLEENMGQIAKKNTLLLRFSNYVETGITLYQFTKTKTTTAQRTQWEDLILAFRNFHSAMEVFEKESSKVKMLYSAPRISFEAEKTGTDVTENDGKKILTEKANANLPSDSDIKNCYEKLLNYRKILLN